MDFSAPNLKLFIVDFTNKNKFKAVIQDNELFLLDVNSTTSLYVSFGKVTIPDMSAHAATLPADWRSNLLPKQYEGRTYLSYKENTQVLDI